MPKITHIDMTPLEFVLAPGHAYGTARGLNRQRTCALIRVTTEDGVVGIGDAAGPLDAIGAYVGVLAPFFIGRSLYDFELVASHAADKLYHFGVQGHFTAALGGINIAIFDAMGKTVGLPVHDLIGGRAAERLSCYATTGYFTDDPANGIDAQLARISDAGFVGVKIKIGAGPASDLERVRITRQILGDEIFLMVDVNGNYTVDIALESLRRIAPFNIHWCEEPLPPWDVAGYAELRRRAPVPIAAGEAHYGAHDFNRLIEARALDIVQPSVISGGGFGHAKAAALLARLHNLRVSPPCWGSAIAVAATVQFAASLPSSPHTDHLPYPMLVEYDVSSNPLRDELLTRPLAPAHGTLPVPTGPGLGITIDEAAIAAYRKR
jgi:D-galactarolactone cycloisomerase